MLDEKWGKSPRLGDDCGRALYLLEDSHIKISRLATSTNKIDIDPSLFTTLDDLLESHIILIDSLVVDYLQNEPLGSQLRSLVLPADLIPLLQRLRRRINSIEKNAYTQRDIRNIRNSMAAFVQELQLSLDAILYVQDPLPPLLRRGSSRESPVFTLFTALVSEASQEIHHIPMVYEGAETYPRIKHICDNIAQSLSECLDIVTDRKSDGRAPWLPIDCPREAQRTRNLAMTLIDSLPTTKALEVHLERTTERWNDIITSLRIHDFRERHKEDFRIVANTHATRKSREQWSRQSLPPSPRTRPPHRKRGKQWDHYRPDTMSTTKIKRIYAQELQEIDRELGYAVKEQDPGDEHWSMNVVFWTNQLHEKKFRGG